MSTQFHHESRAPHRAANGGSQIYPHVTPALMGLDGDAEVGQFDFPKLKFSFDALEPVIDRETLKWHYDVHHRTSLTKLNQALIEMPTQIQKHGRPTYKTLEQILARVSRYPKAVRSHGGAHWNHSFLWSVLSDKSDEREIPEELHNAFEKSYGSVDDFIDYFVHAGSELVGSGWIWLLKTPAGRMKITTTQNHDNPLMDLCEAPGTPILACDLWEHSFHLGFKGESERYVREFLKIVNWKKVCELYDNGSKTDPFNIAAH
jgi:Fe-Mn family superoxide dismutase